MPALGKPTQSLLCARTRNPTQNSTYLGQEGVMLAKRIYKINKNFKNWSYFHLCAFVYVSVCMYAHVCRCPQKTEGGLWSPTAEVTGGCGLFDMGAGNQIQGLWKSRKYFETPNHLSSFTIWIFFEISSPLLIPCFLFLLLVLFVSFQKLPQMSSNHWWLIIIMRVHLDNQQLWPCGWGMYSLGLYFTMTSMMSHLLRQFSNVRVFVLCPLG